jgi:hypothetical protein
MDPLVHALVFASLGVAAITGVFWLVGGFAKPRPPARHPAE